MRRTNLDLGHLDLEADEAGDSSCGREKRANSPSTKKRLAEINARSYDLQKQRGKELKAMIPESFLEEAKNDPGSNRELMHTLNATKLYITSLVSEVARLQEQVGEPENNSVIDDIDDEDDRCMQDRRALRSQARRKNGASTPRDDVTILESRVMDHLSELPNARRKATVRWPEGREDDGTLPPTPTPNICPHDTLLRQAVEKFIALTKESVSTSQGVLEKKHIERLSLVHDCIVDMVNETRKG